MKPQPKTTETGPSTCDFCLGDPSRNKNGNYEEMLFCNDCDAKAHPSCMNYSSSLAAKALSYPWQCVDCKTCTLCYTAEDGASMLFCDGCDKAYHMKCHHPIVTVKPEGKWLCNSCTVEECQLNAGTNGEGKVHENLNHSRKELCNTAGHATNGHCAAQDPCSDVPMSISWTPEEVSDYFKTVGFPNHAHVFVDQEIDGKSLLLLKRTDVIEGLSLKLGPAVKIYEHVSKLQQAAASQEST